MTTLNMVDPLFVVQSFLVKHWLFGLVSRGRVSRLTDPSAVVAGVGDMGMTCTQVPTSYE